MSAKGQTKRLTKQDRKTQNTASQIWKQTRYLGLSGQGQALQMAQDGEYPRG